MYFADDDIARARVSSRFRGEDFLADGFSRHIAALNYFYAQL
jgi:hypothetical protein